LVKTRLANKKLFGMLALSMGFISKEHLQECIEIQESSTIPRRLGSILLSRGYIKEAQLKEILALQGKTGETTDLPQSKSDRRRLIGEILIERGFIDRSTLDATVKHQQLLRKTGISPRIGEILIALGKINPEQLKEALNLQATA